MSFWNKIWRRNTDFEYTKENNKKYWRNVDYLHGLIYSILTDIKELQKENDELRKGRGIWISEEEVKRFNKQLENMKITNNFY